jgi:hypothetical protein
MRFVAFFGVLGMITRVEAQQVLVAPPVNPAAPELQPAPEPVRPAPTETTTFEAATGRAAPRREPFQWGPIRLRPHVDYQLTYGTGIQSQPGQSQKTLVNQLAPGIQIDLGTRWQLDYTPRLVFYSDSNFRDTLNQSILLAGRTSYNDWAFALSQSCDLTSDPQTQTAQQTDQQDYVTQLNAIRRLNTETSLEFDFKQNLLFVQGVTNSVGSSRDWMILSWLDYHWGPNIATAGGAGVGYEAVDVGSDMPYEQLQSRITWHIAHKVNLVINGGAEFRQFVDSTQSQLISPVFGALIDYLPLDVTRLSLIASHYVEASYFQSLATETTSLNATITQRFFGKFYLGLSGGYGSSTYHTSGPVTPGDPSVGRRDNYTSGSASVSVGFLKRGTASAFYSLSSNSSNRKGFGYTSDQVGFQLTYAY